MSLASIGDIASNTSHRARKVGGSNPASLSGKNALLSLEVHIAKEKKNRSRLNCDVGEWVWHVTTTGITSMHATNVTREPLNNMKTTHNCDQM